MRREVEHAFHVIVGDHPVIRLAVGSMLLENQNYKIVGRQVGRGVDAMQMIREAAPDLVILDISIPKLDGLEVLSRFQAAGPAIEFWYSAAQSPALFAVRCMHSAPQAMCASRKDP